MKNIIKHFITITKHRHLVMKLCFKMGIYKQGLLHDLSKYSFVEFFTSAKYYVGTYSPTISERKDKGYSDIWMHHKGRNKHHFEYWEDLSRDKRVGVSYESWFFKIKNFISHNHIVHMPCADFCNRLLSCTKRAAII